MRNRAASIWTAPPGSAPRSLDGRPRLRLLMLGAIVVLSTGAVLARLAYVQTQLAPIYASEFDRVHERLESIPSRDGRILASGGEVLAEDVAVYRVKAHYRWLEEPPDAAWLKHQALARLDRAARKDRTAVERASRQVLETRAAAWSELAALTGIDLEQLGQCRRDVQSRIERIVERVERRRHEHDAEPQVTISTDKGWARPWHNLWYKLRQALTTPPERLEQEPLVVREQLEYHVIVPEIDAEAALQIDSHPERFPGLSIEVATRRSYPRGRAAAHVLGYRRTVDADWLQQRRRDFPNGDPLDYAVGDRVGLAGLEQFYERHLRGLRGERRVVSTRRGEVVRTEVVRQPRPGRDLVLNLNVELQEDAQRLLAEVLDQPTVDPINGAQLPVPPGGAIVALDVRTGGVLAAASGPDFDLNLFVEGNDSDWKRALADPRKPLFSRATEMALPPGSTFKVLSSLAFLQSGKLDPRQTFVCQGYLDDPDRYRCYTYRHFGSGHGEIDLTSALSRSCNVYFFNQARHIGDGPLHEWAHRLGFGGPTGIDLPHEARGNLPRPQRQGKQKQVNGEALGLVIGQARLTATPMQVARLMALVANGGRLVTPRLASHSGLPLLTDGEPTQSVPAEEPANPEPRTIEDLSPQTLEWVQRGMRQVVASPQGTGYKTVRLKEIAIAGKTGTAESGGGKADHAWFGGYVPADEPRIAFVVVLQHAGSGGHAAGPVARRLVQCMLRSGLIAPSTGPDATAAAQ